MKSAKSIVQRRAGSDWWYGRVKLEGKYRPVPLDVKVSGVPPRSRSDDGDESYRRSKWEAEKRVTPLLKELEGLPFPQAITAIKRFGEQMKASKKSGSKVIATNYILAEDIASEWLKLPRKSVKARLGKGKNDGKTHGDQVVGKIGKFLEFCKNRNPRLRYAFEITIEEAEAFIQSEWARGCTGTTCNKTTVNLRSAFKRLRSKIGYTNNPFDGIEKFPKDTVHRKAFTDEQIERLYEEAMKDLWGVGGLIIVGIFSGMREGDCCLLRWEEVNLEEDTYEATPDPTVAEKHNMKTGETIWIPMFPQFKEALKKLNPKKSGYIFPELAKLYNSKPQDLSKQVVSFIEQAFADSKTFVRTVERQHGLRKASIYDFPALRTTWITLAVKSGVPTLLICLVSGHTSEEMILSNYAQPDAKSLQAAFGGKMELLTRLGTTDDALEGEPRQLLLKLQELLANGNILEIERQRKWAVGALQKAIGIL